MTQQTPSSGHTDNSKAATGREVPKWILDHLQKYRQSPNEGHFWDATVAGGHPRTPTLLLTTVGRKSGKQITMPLIYGTDGERHVIVASKGGAPEHPAWYLNLQSNPQVDVQIAERKFHAVARTTSGEERQRLWEMMAGIYPPYPDYQKRTNREIPVVVLEATAY